LIFSILQMTSLPIDKIIVSAQGIEESGEVPRAVPIPFQLRRSSLLVRMERGRDLCRIIVLAGKVKVGRNLGGPSRPRLCPFGFQIDDNEIPRPQFGDHWDELEKEVRLAGEIKRRIIKALRNKNGPDDVA
jgi:hypothetical protein